MPGGFEVAGFEVHNDLVGCDRDVPVLDDRMTARDEIVADVFVDVCARIDAFCGFGGEIRLEFFIRECGAGTHLGIVHVRLVFRMGYGQHKYQNNRSRLRHASD